LRIQFDGYCLDSDRRELRLGDTLVPIQPQVFDLLEYLIANRDRVISKDDLISSIWKGRIVSESTLLSRISAARRAIGDDGGQQRLIRTVSRKGIRFVGTVLILPVEETGSNAAKSPPAATLPGKEIQSNVNDLESDTASSANGPILPLPDKPSIAVLPFLNMTGDPEQEYFTDGVTEDIITELSRFHRLFVIARNSSFSYKGKSPDVRQVGKDLGVRYVLEGSIRKSSNRIRVTGELIDTLTGNHIWAERYDRVLEDIFAVQEELTRAIVAAIAPQIEVTERLKATRPRPSNLSAYEIALRAWVHVVDGHFKADRALLDQSVREAKEALAIDPNSVRALQALGAAYGRAFLLGMAGDREQALQEAMRALTRAIELDPADARGYVLRALNVVYFTQLDRYPEALADARRAHEMNPNDTDLLRNLGLIEALAGEPDRGIEHLHQVMRLNPRDSAIYDTYHHLAAACFLAQRYADGIDWASRVLRERPRMVVTHTDVVLDFIGLGEIGKAKAMFETLQEVASPEYLRARLEGTWPFGRSEDRRRATTFLRIAAGLEDPSAADALR
jgi:TolB-like protein/DNA-binding winged helix-turn-helix (wHTH) protein/Tfp pilus assembly protein PilF